MITVKIHDVIHSSDDWAMDTKELSEYIERYTNNCAVENIRIVKGHTNSPIYVELDSDAMTMKNVRMNCRKVLEAFSHKVTGVQMLRAVRDNNLMVVSDE